MKNREKLTRIRQLLAEGQEAPRSGLVVDDTLGRVLRAAAPWGLLLVRAYLATGFAVMVWGFWFFFRFNHEWAFIKATVSERPLWFFLSPFLFAVPMAILETIAIFLIVQMAKRFKQRRFK